jgi:hypothetical protein
MEWVVLQVLEAVVITLPSKRLKILLKIIVISICLKWVHIMRDQ